MIQPQAHQNKKHAIPHPFVQIIQVSCIKPSHCQKPVFAVETRGRTYIMITYVSKENNLGPDDKIRYIWGLKGPIFIL